MGATASATTGAPHPARDELRDLAGNPVLAPHTPVGPSGGEWRYVRIDLVNVTGVATAVTNVAVVSDPGGDDTYGLEDTIRVRVTFGEPVDVTGTPRLKIRMDPSYGEKWADYASGTGTTMLEFTHTVKEPNLSTRGIKVMANSLELNGGTVGVAGGGGNAALGHDELTHDTDHKVDWRVASDTAGRQRRKQGHGRPDGERRHDRLGPGGRRHLRPGRHHPGAGGLQRGGRRDGHAADRDRHGPGVLGREARELRERDRDGRAGVRLHGGRSRTTRRGGSR